MGKNAQAVFDLGLRQHPTGVELRDDTIDAQYFAPLLETVDETFRRSESHTAFQNIVVSQRLQRRYRLRRPTRAAAGTGRVSLRRRDHFRLTLKIIDDVFAWLLERRLLRIRGIDRHAKIDAAIPGMTGFLPARAIDVEILPQRLQPVAPQSDEQGQTFLGNF